MKLSFKLTLTVKCLLPCGLASRLNRRFEKNRGKFSIPGKGAVQDSSPKSPPYPIGASQLDPAGRCLVRDGVRGKLQDLSFSPAGPACRTGRSNRHSRPGPATALARSLLWYRRASPLASDQPQSSRPQLEQAVKRSRQHGFLPVEWESLSSPGRAGEKIRTPRSCTIAGSRLCPKPPAPKASN
jgi:hypothetical protein